MEKPSSQATILRAREGPDACAASESLSVSFPVSLLPNLSLNSIFPVLFLVDESAVSQPHS